MSFTMRAIVRFGHVDAAGIVFYPRYFEMLNAALEDFFAVVVGVDFHAMHARLGIGTPTVKLECEFMAPSRLGDMLDIGLLVERTGNSSAALCFEVRCGDELRLVARSVIVCMALASAKSTPWPPEIRERLSLDPELVTACSIA